MAIYHAVWKLSPSGACDVHAAIYPNRVTARPAFIKVAKEDERLAAEHQAVADQRTP